MDISINSRHPAVADPATLSRTPAAAPPNGTTKPSLVITETRADVLSGLDEAGDIPDSALRRDDALGQLMGIAFTLPAPPMPTFPA